MKFTSRTHLPPSLFGNGDQATLPQSLGHSPHLMIIASFIVVTGSVKSAKITATMLATKVERNLMIELVVSSLKRLIAHGAQSLLRLKHRLRVNVFHVSIQPVMVL